MRKKIESLEIINLKIPFKQSFKHHSAERKITQSVIVIVSDGTIKGYGESCPREYVTGESISSVFKFFEEQKQRIALTVSKLDDLKSFVNSNDNIISNNPAAWCAIELALLDLFSKQNQNSIEQLLNIPELDGAFAYTAVIGDSSYESFRETVEKYIKVGFNDFKIKINGDAESDYRKLSLLNELTEKKSRIRLDANNLWENADAVVDYLENCPVTIFALEEPLKKKGISPLIELSKKIKPSIILDESLNKIDELEELNGYESKFILNLRVSKMGGLLRSLSIAEAAKKKGIGIIIGAQVGEMSILTRAGLSVSNFIKPFGNAQDKPYPIAMEGAFGTKLLEHDITDDPLMFGLEGNLFPQTVLKINEHGFQIKIREDFILG